MTKVVIHQIYKVIKHQLYKSVVFNDKEGRGEGGFYKEKQNISVLFH